LFDERRCLERSDESKGGEDKGHTIETLWHSNRRSKGNSHDGQKGDDRELHDDGWWFIKIDLGKIEESE
jgi:hypothetical protein